MQPPSKRRAPLHRATMHRRFDCRRRRPRPAEPSICATLKTQNGMHSRKLRLACARFAAFLPRRALRCFASRRQRPAPPCLPCARSARRARRAHLCEPARRDWRPACRSATRWTSSPARSPHPTAAARWRRGTAAPVLPLRGMPREAARVQRSRNTLPPFSSIAMIRSVIGLAGHPCGRRRAARSLVLRTAPALGESSGGTGGTPVAVGVSALRRRVE